MAHFRRSSPSSPDGSSPFIWKYSSINAADEESAERSPERIPWSNVFPARALNIPASSFAVFSRTGGGCDCAQAEPGPYFPRRVRTRSSASLSRPARRSDSTVSISRAAAFASDGKRRDATSRTSAARAASPRFSSASQRAARRTFPPHDPVLTGGYASSRSRGDSLHARTERETTSRSKGDASPQGNEGSESGWDNSRSAPSASLD